jgi:prepilin-type processing-associated H-X9-DG protein
VKTNCSQVKAPRAFTIVELLVVIGLLMTLAALLLPVLAHGLAKAKKIHCNGNLRQIGASLFVYAADFHSYPADLVRLRAAAGGPSPSLTEWKLYWCPAIYHSDHELPPETISYDDGTPAPGKIIMEDYGYNQFGSGSPPMLLGLGLNNQVGMREGAVKNPGDMIAISDVYFQFLFWNSPAPLSRGDVAPWHPYRHLDGSNQLFVDGHAEYARRAELQRPAEIVRRRWNNDDQSHPETWANP